MYDLVMAWRFDRKDTGPKALKILCEMAATFRDEDKTAGRPRGYLTLRELQDQLVQFTSGKYVKRVS
ncbi:MAG TPA: hypothetical protein VIR45_14095 [Kiloniellaceae bacterium]